MGPITLFDKSFLQMLSVDESVWFDSYFMANVCPLFYVETLADLEKPGIRDGRTAEQEVAIIANKTPEMSGGPCSHHRSLCLAELTGTPVPMTGQIPVSGGKVVMADGKSGVVYDKFPEALAFHRWQRQQFREVERLFARDWRSMVTNLDLKTTAEAIQALGIDAKSCKSLEQAKAMAEEAVSGNGRPFDRIRLVHQFIDIPEALRDRVMQRWSLHQYRRLSSYAPYVAHVATVEVFFQIALAAGLISSERPSNRIDIGYLFYLPFCMLFVSNDKLHRRCAPLFLRSDQEFVWGADLKADLSRVNAHFLALPEVQRDIGAMKLARQPVGSDNDLLIRLYDRHAPGWRRDPVEVPRDPEFHRNMVEHLNRLTDAPPLNPRNAGFNPVDADQLSIKRLIRRRKGSWFQVPKDLPDPDEPDASLVGGGD